MKIFFFSFLFFFTFRRRSYNPAVTEVHVLVWPWMVLTVGIGETTRAGARLHGRGGSRARGPFPLTRVVNGKKSTGKKLTGKKSPEKSQPEKIHLFSACSKQAYMSRSNQGQHTTKPFLYVGPTPNTIFHVNLQVFTTNLRRVTAVGEVVVLLHYTF